MSAIFLMNVKKCTKIALDFFFLKLPYLGQK